MSSSVSTQKSPPDSAPPVLRWWTWPLRQALPGSLCIPLIMLGASGMVGYSGGSWLMGIVALITMSLALASYLLPVRHEVHAGGFQHLLLGSWGRARVVPWGLVQCYQPRATGILLFRTPGPTFLNAMSAEFLPYDSDPDELLCAVRQFLPHAEELPERS